MLVSTNLLVGVALSVLVHPWAGLAWLLASFGAWALGIVVAEKQQTPALMRMKAFGRDISRRVRSKRDISRRKWDKMSHIGWKRCILQYLERWRRPPEW